MFNPLVVGLFALVCVIVFAAGREERSSPELTAGAALVLGCFAVGLVTIWALTVPINVVRSFPTTAAFEYHRHLLVLVALAIPVSAAWYARALGLL